MEGPDEGKVESDAQIGRLFKSDWLAVRKFIYTEFKDIHDFLRDTDHIILSWAHFSSIPGVIGLVQMEYILLSTPYPYY